VKAVRPFDGDQPAALEGAVDPLACQQRRDEECDVVGRGRKLQRRADAVELNDAAAHVLGPVRATDRLDERQSLGGVHRIELVADADHLLAAHLCARRAGCPAAPSA
jgi:hypothetical protein